MKILNIINNMGDGGAQKIILNYAADFQKYKNMDFSILALSNETNDVYKSELIKNNIKIKYLSIISRKKGIFKKIDVFIKTNNEILAYLKDLKPDIVHVHLFGALMYSLRAINKAHIPLRFYTLHSDPSRFKGVRLKILRRAFKKYNFIPICVTKEQAEFSRVYYRFKNYEVVHNGIDIEEIKRSIISKKLARKIFNLSKHDFVICAVGRLNKIKQFNLLISIVNNMLKTKKNIKLLIAGDGPEKNNLIYLTKKLNMENNVIFLGNIMNTTELYCASDVLVITSESESSSLVLLEAQVCKLRCVISCGVPNESIITNNVKKMQKESSIEEWINAILDINYRGKSESNIEEYEVHAISKKMNDIYLRYWKNYNNEKE